VARFFLVQHLFCELTRLSALGIPGLIEEAPDRLLIDKPDLSSHDPGVEEDKIREALVAYLRGDINLSNFRELLLGVTIDNAEAPQLAHAIEFFLDEAASGQLQKPALDEELRRLVHVRASELV